MYCRTIKIIFPALLVTVLTVAGPRWAAATNCTAAGISTPCVIASSGSYTVTADITVFSTSNSGTHCPGTGICINSGVKNVSINLNGHTISASGTNVAAAISDGGTSAAGVAVTDGIIDGGNTSGHNFSVAGVLATGKNARAERLQVRNSGSGSGKASIHLGDGAVAVKNVVTNGLNSNNNATEISCGIDCVISHNVANAGSGVTGTTGISTGNGGLVEENTVMGNATGLSLGTSTGYGENVLMNSTANVSGGTNMGQNVCNGVTTC